MESLSEDSNIPTHCHGNLKSHKYYDIWKKIEITALQHTHTHTHTIYGFIQNITAATTNVFDITEDIVNSLLSMKKLLQ